MTLRTALAAALLTLALAACEDDPNQVSGATNVRENIPPKGPTYTGDWCAVIKNRAPFTITGRLQMKSRERATFRIAKGRTERVCLSGESYGGGTISFTLTNFVTVPLFHCWTDIQEVLEVTAYQSGDGWLYNVNCKLNTVF